MALPPKFAGHKFSPAASEATTKHTVELFLDYTCPYSKKMFVTLWEKVIPALKSHDAGSKVDFIFRQQIQPWHPSSTLLHEVALAVLKLDHDSFWAVSAALFAAQNDFCDVNVVNETRNETYERLAKIAADAVGVDAEKVMDLVRVPDQPSPEGDLNLGNEVTVDVKLVTRMNRVTGVHVTPTVFFNGIEQGSISSSFTHEQWMEWIEKNVV